MSKVIKFYSKDEEGIYESLNEDLIMLYDLYEQINEKMSMGNFYSPIGLLDLQADINLSIAVLLGISLQCTQENVRTQLEDM